MTNHYNIMQTNPFVLLMRIKKDMNSAWTINKIPIGQCDTSMIATPLIKNKVRVIHQLYKHLLYKQQQNHFRSTLVGGTNIFQG